MNREKLREIAEANMGRRGPCRSSRPQELTLKEKFELAKKRRNRSTEIYQMEEYLHQALGLAIKHGFWDVENTIQKALNLYHLTILSENK